MPDEMKFVGNPDSPLVSAADLDQHMRYLGTRGDRSELDLETVVTQSFASGAGVLAIGLDTPDHVILAVIKQAVAIGVPFTVIPTVNPAGARNHAEKATEFE